MCLTFVYLVAKSEINLSVEGLAVVFVKTTT